MAKFAYNMQSILDIKAKLESQEKIAFTNAQYKLRSEEQKMSQFQDKRLYYENKMRSRMIESLNIQELSNCNQGISLMKEAMEMQQIEVDAAQKNVDKAQIRLNEAMIQRKTHEKLRDNAFEEFIKEINVQESKEIDELVSYNYASMA